MTRFQTSAVSISLLLAACASPGDYPSLATRDVERVSGTFEPVASTYVPPPAPVEALGMLEGLRSRATNAHRAFLEQAPATRPAVVAGRGAPEGTDAWARAHIALAALESTRAPALVALAELDRIYTDVLVDAAQIGAIEEARSEVVAMVESEDRLIAEMSAQLVQ